MNERPRLDSWKEIAGYLGRDIRTVIRWEQNRGLPVYRVPGGKLPRVFAYQDELDQWLASRPAAENGSDEPAGAPPGTALLRHRAGIGVAILGVGLLGLGAGWALTRGTAGVPRQLVIAGDELRAVDAAGRTSWSQRFESPLIASPSRWTHVGDIDGDARDDFLASLEVANPSSSQHQGQLARFSAEGRLQWSATASDRFAFRDAEYGPPWAAADLSVYRAGAETRIAWVVHHFTWWPGLLITLDAQGQRLGTFVNSGWIRAATPSLDRRHLFISGVSNSRRAYFVAVLDANNPTGRSPEPPGSEMECVRCPDGGPVRYFVFPRTDVSRTQTFPGDSPTVMTFEDGTVEVHSLESGGPTFAAVIYRLSPDLGIADAKFSDSFWEWHRRLEAEGKLQHRAEECPERLGLEIQSWTPATGWQPTKVPVR